MTNPTQTTSRIQFKNFVLYVHSNVITRLRHEEIIVQLNQKYFPAAQCIDQVIKRLIEIARKEPGSFSKGSRLIMKSNWGA